VAATNFDFWSSIKNGIALSLLTEKRIRYADVKFEKIDLHDENHTSLNVQVQFLGDFETEMQLESELAARQIDLPDWDISKLNVEFRHLARDELQAAWFTWLGKAASRFA
jgi:hypothetical protein